MDLPRDHHSSPSRAKVFNLTWIQDGVVHFQLFEPPVQLKLQTVAVKQLKCWPCYRNFEQDVRTTAHFKDEDGDICRFNAV